MAALAAHGIIPANGAWHSLRGGRTNRVWRAETTTGPLVCKLFGGDVTNPLYPNLPEAEFETLRALSGRDIAPDPIKRINTELGEVLVYRFIEGQSWRNGVQDVAALLAKIHALPLALPLRPVASGSKALVQQTRRILGQCQNAMNAVPNSVFGPEITPISNPVLIHTDVVPNNLITTPQGLRLIDWQCPGLGDPCEDIASFLSPSMQHLYGRPPLSPDQIEAFLAAYAKTRITARYRRLAPLFHWRAAAYCLWKLERGCEDYKAAQAFELSALQETRRQSDDAGQNDTYANIA
ncbi:MAG: aminoglycoside phosphotransferase family protein [Alphaproteobacteria bacterium]|nr:aminoglycoside phosphotransferase family protein [Alphaproteobacteria bacterium]